jgi:hypothetical protein
MIETTDYGILGQQVLTERIATLEERAHRRMMTPVELSEKRGCEKALAETEALIRARAKNRETSLGVVLAQMEELEAAGLTFDCLNMDDIEEIRKLASKGITPK